eukprot:1153815-Pelagomonas_calceolata.AAC.3
MEMSAFEKKVLFTLHITLGITSLTSRGNSVISCGLLDFQGMDTKAKLSHTADNVFGLGWESTSVMISKFFAVCVSWVVTRKLSPICEIARFEIHNKLTQVQMISGAYLLLKLMGMM